MVQTLRLLVINLRYSEILASNKVPNEEISRFPKIQDIFISLNLKDFCGDLKFFEHSEKEMQLQFYFEI